MARNKTQWARMEPDAYQLWLKDFEKGPFVRKMLAKLERLDAEVVRKLLFLDQIGPSQLTQKEVRAIWPKQKINSRIDVTDYVIAWLVAQLEDKGTRTVNADVAALLTAAGVPNGRSKGEWSAEAIKKRKRRARSTFVASFLGPRYFLKKRLPRLY